MSLYMWCIRMYTFYLRTQKESRAESSSFDRVRWEKIVKVFFGAKKKIRYTQIIILLERKLKAGGISVAIALGF